MANKTPTEILEELRVLLARPDPVQFAREMIGPPAAVYITRDDLLYVRSRNAVTGLVLTVAGRLQKPDGELVPFSFVHTPAADRSVSLLALDLAEGFLRSIVCFISTGTARRGQTFVELGLLRGLAAAASVRTVLVKDYVTVADAIGWPGGRIISSVEGRGMLRSVTGADPVAGAEITDTVPADARWLFLGGSWALVTAVAVANRQVHLLIDDGANVLFRTVSASVQTASLTHQYNAGNHGISAAAIATEHWLPTPADAWLFQGWRLRTATDALQAADDFGPATWWIEEFIED